MTIPVEELLKDHQKYHSDLQIESFILAKNGITPYGVYKQAVRELKGRYDALRSSAYGRDLLLIDIAELKAKPVDGYDALRRDIELQRKQDALRAHEENEADMFREYNRFLEIASELKEQIGELTPERRNELDRDMWVQRLVLGAVMDMASTGRISAGTQEAILSLPDELHDAIVRMLPANMVVKQALLDRNGKSTQPALPKREF